MPLGQPASNCGLTGIFTFGKGCVLCQPSTQTQFAEPVRASCYFIEITWLKTHAVLAPLVFGLRQRLFLKSAEELKLWVFLRVNFRKGSATPQVTPALFPSAVTAGVISQAHSRQSFSPTCLWCLTRCLYALHGNHH